MFNLVTSVSKNIPIFQGKILWKVVESAAKLFSVTANITVIFTITTKTKLKSCIAAQYAPGESQKLSRRG